MESAWALTSDILEFLWCDRARIKLPFRARVSHLDNTMKPSKTKCPRPQLQPLHTGKSMPLPLVFTWFCWDEVCLRWPFSVPDSHACGWNCLRGLGLSLIFGKIWRKGTGKRQPEEDLYSLSDSSWKTPWGFGNTPALGLQSNRCPS